MVVDSSTGLDLNSAGVDLQGIDVLWDIPQVISVARLRYANGTRMEFAVCKTNVDSEDLEVARTMSPTRAVPLQGFPSNTLGCGHGDEYTTACWLFE
jgi:hypothetical protein